MTLSLTLNTAVRGMAGESARLAGAARAVADPAAAAAGGTTMEEALLTAIDAGIGFRANAAVFETGADLWDLLATIKRD